MLRQVRLLLPVVLQVLTAYVVLAQSTAPATPALDLPLWVSNNTGQSVGLHFGLDPQATDGIDPSLGELELPPFPPPDAFEARFVGTDIGINLGMGVRKDYRQGTLPPSGTRVYELRYQLGSGTAFALRWDLPEGVTARLQDFVTGSLIDVAMRGADSAVVPKADLVSRLRLTVSWTTNGVASAGRGQTVPACASLGQNYPNPFNPSTVIPFQIPAESQVRIRVYNAIGQLVEELLEGTLPAGAHTVNWRPRVSSGLYFARLEVRPAHGSAAPTALTISMILAR